jgi:hypothetical protein
MDSPTVTQNTPNELADDILRGADQIAEFIFGKRGSRRKVYYLAECSRLPVFRLGSVRTQERIASMDFRSGKPGARFSGIGFAAFRIGGLGVLRA